jgi:2-iminobutanoate/2-iminopropanoate deaminase
MGYEQRLMHNGKVVIESSKLPPPGGPYSPAIMAGGFIFVSGQAAVDPKTGQVVGNTIEEQTERTLENVKIIVTAAGASLDDVVRVTVYLADITNFSRMNEVYKRYFSHEPPARTTLEARLARGELLVEIDAVAYKA